MIVDLHRSTTPGFFWRIQGHHSPICPEERAKTPGGQRASARDLPHVVDGRVIAVSSTERPEVDHVTVGPEEGVLEARGRGAVTHDLSVLVDGMGRTVPSAERAEVDHHAVGPKERVGLSE